MRRALVAALIAMASGTVASQMMGGRSITTSQYFPLVDGARYDYVYTSGPWATSSAIMHGGQAWAGVSGLTAMHTTYTCVIGVPCAPDATDFYRMDPDGMHYFGGTGADPTGMQYSMMSYTSPEWLMKNPVTPGTMMAGGGYRNMESWGMAVTGSGNMMGNQSYMSSYQALALETVTTPAGTFSNALHVREQRGNGYVREVWYAPGVGMVKMMDANNMGMLSGYTIPGAVAQSGIAAPLAFTPQMGLWWNPNESGTGYNIQVQHGVMVVTMYSYVATGDPLWYLVVGTLSNSGTGVAASGPLTKYRGGQCASCMYQEPSQTGDDGSLTVTFTSAVTATVQLPGGRVTQIQPEAW